MNIRPIGERLLVKPLKVEEKTSTGIILPESEKKSESNIGEVIAIGDTNIVNIGDKIIFKKFSGAEIKNQEEKYLILEIKDILALIK